MIIMFLKYKAITIIIDPLSTKTSFSGSARQMGADSGGLGAFAIRTGRMATSVVRRYIVGS